MVTQAMTHRPVNTNSHRCSSTFRAVKLGHVQCLQNFTVSQLSEVDGNGQSILHLAARLGDVEITKFVINNVPCLLDVQNNFSETPLLTAVGYGHQKLVEHMLDGSLKDCLRRALHSDINGTTCLMASVAQRNNDLALWLLRRFGKPLASQFNACKMLPLHVAAANGNIEFIRIVTKYDSYMVNFKDQFGCTPIIYAAQSGCLSSLRYMVEKLRCDVWCASSKGQTVLHIAALCGHAHIAKWLICRAGTEAMMHQTLHQANAVHCAAFAGHLPVLQVFLEPWSRKKRRHLLMLSDARGNTPLHLAAIGNHIEVVQYLLDNGANPRLLNGSGQSAEHIAHIRNCFALAQMICNHSCKRNKRVKSAKSCTDISHPLTLDGNIATGSFSAPQSIPLRTAIAFPVKYFETETYARPRSVPKLQYEEVHMNTVSQYKLNNESTQTNADLLLDKVKIIDDGWLGEATAAVEEIDKILVNEIEV
uniref:ANK_REP_REGION domain-containing protein n=1 Tax=Steinernema glaseri TaxID=37863 RepID=A0A1I7ZEJ1_9BILA